MVLQEYFTRRSWSTRRRRKRSHQGNTSPERRPGSAPRPARVHRTRCECCTVLDFTWLFSYVWIVVRLFVAATLWNTGAIRDSSSTCCSPAGGRCVSATRSFQIKFTFLSQQTNVSLLCLCTVSFDLWLNKVIVTGGNINEKNHKKDGNLNNHNKTWLLQGLRSTDSCSFIKLFGKCHMSFKTTLEITVLNKEWINSHSILLDWWKLILLTVFIRKVYFRSLYFSLKNILILCGKLQFFNEVVMSLIDTRLIYII